MNAISEPGVTGKRRGRKPKEGRVEGGQEKVINRGIVFERAEELVRLKVRADEASEDFGTAIKKAAEDSGLIASVVRRYIVAKAGEKFEERRRETNQLSLLFEPVQ